MSLENYTKKEKLGEGTYGVVYRAVDNRTGEIVALKQMRLEQEEEGIPVTALREIALMKNLKHTNIVLLKEVITGKGSLTMVSEYLEYDLRKYMDSTRSGVHPALLKSYAFQLLCGICYLHSNRIMHRDMKPQNLLINRDGFLKICDFGLARTFTIPPRHYTHEVVTLWYRPVEILMSAPMYDIAVDVWGVGCIIAEMVTGNPLFAGDSEIDQLFRIFRVLGTPNEETWPGFTKLPGYQSSFPTFQPQDLGSILNIKDPNLIDLLKQLLEINPSKRISAMRALQHPFFADVPSKLVTMCLPAGCSMYSPSS